MPRLSLRLGVLVLALIALPRIVAAAPIVIDFDSLSDGEVVIAQFAGLTFSDATALSAGLSLNEFEFPPRSGLLVVSDTGGPMRIDFGLPVTDVGGYFTYAQPFVLRAFDSTNTLLGSVLSAFSSNAAVSGDLGSLPNEFLQLALPGMSYITMTGDPAGGSFTLDDLTYTPGSTSTAVPEPGTLGLVLFGGLSVLRSRRRRRT